MTPTFFFFFLMVTRSRGGLPTNAHMHSERSVSLAAACKPWQRFAAMLNSVSKFTSRYMTLGQKVIRDWKECPLPQISFHRMGVNLNIIMVAE